MARKSKKKSNLLFEKLAALLSLLILVSAGWLGHQKVSDQQVSMLDALVGEHEKMEWVKPNLYRVSEQGSGTDWLSIGEGIGYGGAMTLAIRIDPNGEVTQASVLGIKDTSSYVEKVIEAGYFDKILGTTSKNDIAVDGVSGATLTSEGILQAINLAADPVRQELFGYQIAEEHSPFSALGWIDALAVIIFGLAAWVSRSSSAHKMKMQWTVMLCSMVIFGFYAAALVSSSTMAILISGSWVRGLGDYTALILLVLTVCYILLFNKNLYCQMICPMGTAQQCLSKLTNAKAVSLKYKALVWFPRAILLAVLTCNFYFQNPAGLTYEPFGIMFGMVGSLTLFIGTILILLTSLFIHRPWCKTLCPATAAADLLLFIRSWVRNLGKSNKKKNNKKAKAPRSKRPASNDSIAIKVKEI